MLRSAFFYMSSLPDNTLQNLIEVIAHKPQEKKLNG